MGLDDGDEVALLNRVVRIAVMEMVALELTMQLPESTAPLQMGQSVQVQ